MRWGGVAWGERREKKENTFMGLEFVAGHKNSILCEDAAKEL